MTEDVVRAFGFLTLGTRFKRLGDRLQADTQRIMDGYGLPIQVSQFPLLAAIDRLERVSIGELAAAVGVTQPGVTRVVGQLERIGLVASEPGTKDQRQKIVFLTEAGRDIIERSRRDIWPRVEAAVADLCGELTGPLLDQLAAIEDGLAERPLPRRAPPIPDQKS